MGFKNVGRQEKINFSSLNPASTARIRNGIINVRPNLKSETFAFKIQQPVTSNQ